MNLSEEDLKHIQQMTTRLQINVYLALIKFSNNRKINLIEALPLVCEQTHYTQGVVLDVYERLKTDEHIQQQGKEWTIGRSSKWQRQD